MFSELDVDLVDILLQVRTDQLSEEEGDVRVDSLLLFRGVLAGFGVRDPKFDLDLVVLGLDQVPKATDLLGVGEGLADQREDDLLPDIVDEGLRGDGELDGEVPPIGVLLVLPGGFDALLEEHEAVHAHLLDLVAPDDLEPDG